MAGALPALLTLTLTSTLTLTLTPTPTLTLTLTLTQVESLKSIQAKGQLGCFLLTEMQARHLVITPVIVSSGEVPHDMLPQAGVPSGLRHSTYLLWLYLLWLYLLWLYLVWLYLLWRLLTLASAYLLTQAGVLSGLIVETTCDWDPTSQEC